MDLDLSLDIDSEALSDIEDFIMDRPLFEPVELWTDCPYASYVEFGASPTHASVPGDVSWKIMVWANLKFPELDAKRRRAIVSSALKHIEKTGTPPVYFMGVPFDLMVGERLEVCFDEHRAGTRDVARKLKAMAIDRLDNYEVRGVPPFSRTKPTTVNKAYGLRNSFKITTESGQEVY